MRAIVIKQPWIGHILEGRKTWEIRSRPTAVRERIGLIQSKSGRVLGTCELVDCVGPMSAAELSGHFEKHRVPDSVLGEFVKDHAYAWVLSNVRLIRKPEAYRHPNGAVIWVTLTSENCPGLANL